MHTIKLSLSLIISATLLTSCTDTSTVYSVKDNTWTSARQVFCSAKNPGWDECINTIRKNCPKGYKINGYSSEKLKFNGLFGSAGVETVPSAKKLMTYSCNG